MKIAKELIFLLIRLYTWPLVLPKIMKLSFQKVRRKEFWHYYDHVFLNDYPHIRRACTLLTTEKSPVIFDIGGGQGTTLCLFLEQLPGSIVHLFEPLTSNFKLIEKQFGNKSNVTLHRLAAGDSNEKRTIHIADRVTSSSLHTLNPQAHEADSYLAQALKPSGQEEINVVRLDSFLEKYEHIHLLKLDVQGFELNVLEGCGEDLKRVKYVLLEVSNHHGYKEAALYYDLDAYLRDKGFQVADIFPGIKSNGFLKEWDCIYLNEAWK